MNKKKMIILGVLCCLSFAWLNWILLPGYGLLILKITFPFYCALIFGGWYLGYRVSEKKSAKLVKAANQYANTAVQSLNEMMLRSSEADEYYKHRARELDETADRNRRELQKISEQRLLLAAEAEHLNVQQNTQKAYEELEARLNTCEQEKSILRNQLKRKKKALEIIVAEDDEEQKRIDDDFESQ